MDTPPPPQAAGYRGGCRPGGRHPAKVICTALPACRGPSRPPGRSQRMHLVPMMTWSPPRQGRRERRQDRAESDCPENSSRSQSSRESRVRMSPTGSQTEPPACLCPGYTLPDLRLDSRRPGDPPTVCVSPVWATGTQGHVGMSRAPSS